MSASRCPTSAGAGGEDGDAALERLERPQAQARRDRAVELAADRDDEVGDEPAVEVEIRVELVPGPTTSTRRSASIGGIAVPLAVEDDASGRSSAARRAPSEDVRDERPARRARRRRGGSRSSARRRARRSRGGRRRRGGRNARARRGRRPTAAARRARARAARRGPSRRRRLAVAREQPRDLRRDRGLPTRLPVPITAIDGSRRTRSKTRRVEAEVGAEVRQARRRARARPSRCARPARGLARPRGRPPPRRRRSLDERHAVVELAAQLLRAADEDRADPVVRELGKRAPHDLGRMLPVDVRRVDLSTQRAVGSRVARS